MLNFAVYESGVLHLFLVCLTALFIFIGYRSNESELSIRGRRQSWLILRHYSTILPGKPKENHEILLTECELEVVNAWSYSVTPLHVCIAWCSFKHRGQLYKSDDTKFTALQRQNRKMFFCVFCSIITMPKTD